MQAEPFAEGFGIFWMTGQFGKDLDFDGTEKRLGRPETQTNLHDVLRRGMLTHN